MPGEEPALDRTAGATSRAPCAAKFDLRKFDLRLAAPAQREYSGHR
jgi:hypothetical protein